MPRLRCRNESYKMVCHYYSVILLRLDCRLPTHGNVMWGNAFRENFRAEERVADVLRSKASSLTTPRRVVFELLHEPYAKARRCKRRGRSTR